MSNLVKEIDPDALFTLLKGEPGTRKSTCALSYPMPQYWISSDLKMNALALPAMKWGIDISQIESDDYTDYDSAKRKLELLETKCKFKTIIVDSITSMGDNMVRQTLKDSGEKVKIGNISTDSLRDYKAEASGFRELISLLNSIRKYHHIHVVIIAHVVGQRADDPSNKLTHHSRIIVTGGEKIAAKISSYCEEAYHFNVKPGPTETSSGEYSCLTVHTGNDYARTCLDLPREIVFNDKPLFNDFILKGVNKMKVLKAKFEEQLKQQQQKVTPLVEPKSAEFQ